MTTTHKDPHAVIKQLVEALKELDKDWREFNRTYYGLQGEATDDFYSLATTKAALAAGREALKLRTCTWTQHDDVHMPSTYETECGALWSFVEGGPSENKTKFCHGCGGLVCAPVGINGLTEAETSASMSVLGLSKPTEPAPSVPVAAFDRQFAAAEAMAARIMELEDKIESLTQPAPSTAGERPTCFIADRGFRWDGDAQHHVPQLLIAEVSGGTASAGVPGYAAGGNGELK